jgi:glutamate-1-semialdehyde 2,1-aminomutase
MSVAEASGPVRHIGTYNGSAISVAAANATLESLARGGEELYARLDSLGSRLAAGLREVAAACGAPLLVNQVGSVLHLLWGPRTPVRTYEDASHSDRAAVADIAAGLLGSGIMALERGLWFVCAAHTPAEIEATIAAAEEPVAAALATTERQRPGALSR